MLKALRFIDTSILLVYNQIKFSMSDILITFEKSGLEILMMCSGGPKPLGCSVLEMTKRYVNMFSEDLKQGFEDYNPLDRLKKNTSRTQKVTRNE